MTPKNVLKLLSTGCIAALLLVGADPPRAAATTGHPIFVDCNVDTVTVPEWQPDENMGPGSKGPGGGKLFVTWDSDKLYFGMKPPFDYTTIYIDTAPGGAITGTLNHSIAKPGGGYEHAYFNFGGLLIYKKAVEGVWVPQGSPPAGTSFCYGTGGPDKEWAIPWASIGIPPGTSLTILVENWTPPDTVTEYWPAVSGNSNPPPAFTQGFVFTAPGADGVSPAGSPTTVTLDSLTAASGAAALWGALALGAVGLTAGVALIRRRR